MWIITLHLQETELSIEKYTGGIKSSMTFQISKDLKFSWVNLGHKLQDLLQNGNAGFLIQKLSKNLKQEWQNNQAQIHLHRVRGTVWLHKSQWSQPALSGTKLSIHWAFLCERCSMLNSLLQIISFNPFRWSCADGLLKMKVRLKEVKQWVNRG
jgi:hypothetical protein